MSTQAGFTAPDVTSPMNIDIRLAVSNAAGVTDEDFVRVTVLPVDSDGDGLADNWERQNFGDLNNGAEDDPDGDGLSNEDEFALGTDPNVANPIPMVTTLQARAGLDRNILLWENLPQASSYNLYWSTTAGVTPQTGTPINNVQPGYVHTGLTAGQPYYYVVEAVYGAGRSAPSNEAWARTGFTWREPVLVDEPEKIFYDSDGDGQPDYWESATVISGLKFEYSDPGQGVAVWVKDLDQYDGLFGSTAEVPQQLFATTYAYATGWAPRLRIDLDDDLRSISPVLATAPGGRAITAWLRDVESLPIRYKQLWASTLVPGSGWETPARMDTCSAQATIVAKIAADDAGNGLLVWLEPDGTAGAYGNLYARRYDILNGWSLPQLLFTGSVPEFELAMAEDGSARLLWLELTSASNTFPKLSRCREMTYDPSVGWSASADPCVDALYEGIGTSMHVASSPAGFIVMAWRQTDATTGEARYMARGFVPGVGWLQTEVLTSPFSNSRLTALEVNSSGDVMLGWDNGSYSLINLNGVWANETNLGVTQVKRKAWAVFDNSRNITLVGNGSPQYPPPGGIQPYPVLAQRYSPALGWEPDAIDIDIPDWRLDDFRYYSGRASMFQAEIVADHDGAGYVMAMWEAHNRDLELPGSRLLASTYGPVDANMLPIVAWAGPDKTVKGGTIVTLGSADSYSASGAATYSWQQLSGTPVTLSGAGTARVSFTAPFIAQTDTLVFQFTVTDSNGASQSDTVSVSVIGLAPSFYPLGDLVINARIVSVSGGTASVGSITAPTGSIDFDPEALPMPVNIQPPYFDDPVDGQILATSDIDLTQLFGLGTFNITWSATDSDGYTASTTQQVSIVDVSPPVINSGQVTINLNGGAPLSDAQVIPLALMDIQIAEASPFTLSYEYLPAAGKINWTVTDQQGLASTKTWPVIIYP